MPKIKMTDSTLSMFSRLQASLGDREFRDNLNMQLKDYELTPEFVERFKDYIDIAKLSATSLTPELIKALGSDFDFNAWYKSNSAGNRKNIDILMDEQFYSDHKTECDDILATGKAITSKLYLKYFATSEGSIKANMLLNYDGPEVTYDDVIKCVQPLGARFFEVPYVKRNIINDEAKIKKLLETTGIFQIDMPFLMTLMLESYCPNEIDECLESAYIADTSAADISASGNLEKYTNMVHEIIQKYPNKTLDAFMSALKRHMPDILKNQALLKEYLVFCDGISENTLIDMFDDFVIQGLRDQLVTYAKNYGYANLLVVLKLGS